jgi:GDP-L-fucose synthase
MTSLTAENALVFLLKGDSSHVVKVTSRQLPETIAEVVGYQVDLVFSATRPDGTPRKPMDSEHLQGLGWARAQSLKDGIADAHAGFVGRDLL